MNSTYRRLVDADRGLVDRSIFTDAEIYRQELRQIFSRAWLFMCHDSQIPKKGDYFQTYMGEEKVIAVRNRQGTVDVLVNACRHRGGAVCRASSGNAVNFVCAYHGWTYDLNGELLGVPGFNELYGRSLDRSSWGLRKAAQVSSYRGFTFATLDEDAPPLETFLGPAGLGMIDRLANFGDIEIVPGILKHRLAANWKFGVENDQDYYHVGISHASAFDAWDTKRSDVNREYWDNNHGDAWLGEYGHVMDTMPGHYHATLFPHVSMLTDLLQVLIVRHPKGAHESELWYFNFVDRNAAPEERAAIISRNIMRIGPTGMIEQDDGENWVFCTQGASSAASADIPFNYQMGLGEGQTQMDENAGFPVYSGQRTSEEYARWRLSCWTEWMDAESWADLIQNHSRGG